MRTRLAAMNAISAAESTAVTSTAATLAQLEEYLDDPRALHLLHGHRDLVGMRLLALVGDAAEEIEDPASHGIEGLVGQVEPGGGIEFFDGELAGDTVGGGIQLLDEALLLVELVADLAHQLLEQILEGDQARGAAVFVCHDGEVELDRKSTRLNSS